MRLPVAVDYIAERSERISASYPALDGGGVDRDGGLTPQWSASQSDQAGVPCGGAADPAKCQAALAALRLLAAPSDPATCNTQGQVGPAAACVKSYIVYTRGDSVGTAATLGEAKALFGQVDTAGEAWILSRFFGGGSPSCSSKYPALAPTATAVGDGYELRFPVAQCSTEEEVTVRVSADGTVTLVERKSLPADPCAIGRRPEGLVVQRDGVGASPVGRFFARATELEGASVVSFRRLAAELTRERAPRRLARRARRSAADEVRHARATARLARRFGASPLRPRVARVAARSLEAIARENAVEGCVRETYGAVVAHVQASQASDPGVRAAMRAIAADETRHAELSWRLHRWALWRLDEEQRAAVRAAMSEAVVALREELRATPEPDLVALAGVPTAARAEALVAELERTLWASELRRSVVA